MQKLLLPFILLAAFIAGASQTASAQNSLVGKWMGIDEKDTVYFTFDKDGYVIMGTAAEEMGGKNFLIEGIIPASLTYTIKTATKPYHIDITLKTEGEESQVVGIMPGIYEFVDANTVKLYMNADTDLDGSSTPEQVKAARPKTFSTKDGNIIFKRVKQ